MSQFLKIKPYYISNPYGFEYANAIMWSVQELNRGDMETTVYRNLVNISMSPVPDGNGIPIQTEFISPSLMSYEMIATQTILDSWGPDSVIDDFVLTYDPLLEKE